jgi:hypothetical protein
MARGARVVTVNSSGASRTKPKVRPNWSPLHAVDAAAQAVKARAVVQRLVDPGITLSS